MHRYEDRKLYEAVVRARDEGRTAALATIVSAKGSTPRKVGTKMLVHGEGDLVGTVGGGCGEGEVLEAAREVMRTGRSQTVHVDLTEDLLSWSPAVCGGVMEVFIEAIGSGGEETVGAEGRVAEAG